MYRSFGVLLALFVVLHAAKVRKQLASQCVPEDVTFMVDSSSYVGADYFRMQLDFIKATITNYNVAPQCTRVSLVTFSDGAYNQFYLNQYQDKASLFNAIDNIQYNPAPHRYSTEGLKYMMANSFSTLHGGRNNVPHIGIMVSNGLPANTDAFLQTAQQAKADGIKLYTVGVGAGGHLQQFATAASSPYSRYSLVADSYSSLNDLSYPLAYRTMSEVPVSSGPKQTCLQRADIVFLVDGSGSIGPTNFDKLKTFLKGITNQLDVGADKVHVGVEQFSNYPSIEFPLNGHTTNADLSSAIDNINYMSGGTNTGSAIDYMSQQMFSQTSGARPNVPRIAVVITDGKSSSSAATAAAADQARLNHISMLAVGVGNGVDINELHSIADDPDSSNTFTVSSYDQLNSIATQIIQKACAVRATAPPVSSNNNAGATLPPDPCQDSLADCKRYGQSVCVDYAPWAHDNCQRYCGFCNPLYTTAPPPCVDLLSNCPNYGSSVCSNALYQGWAKDNCRKFCGFCGPSVSAVGFYGKCSYKGKSYNPGEKWTDGCDYECICEDGASGRYKCYNRCPLYYNLPAECTLVRDPQECCQRPVCNFNQNLQTFEQTSPARTPTGVGVCVYKGKQYFESQSWKDGCDYQCTCVNGNTGLYKCQSLCPQYQSLPPYCHMVKKAGECCAKPSCEFNTQSGSFTGTGSISGDGVGKTPTTPPPCVNQLSNCERYGQDVCTGFASWATVNCRKYCNMCNVQPTAAPADRCMYQGQAYSQGQGWKVSCDTECVCENAIYGYYRCTNTCPSYNNLPKGCYEVKKAGQCCPVVQCEDGILLTSTNNLGTIGSGGLISVLHPPVPQAIPTLPTGGQPLPGTGGTGFLAPSLKGCLYKGEMYIQDQIWNDECKYTCECQDASTGLYKCDERCPTYLNLPAECTMVTDPNNSCCKKPTCPDPNTPIVPTFGQSNIGHGIVQPPSSTDLYQNYSPIPYTVIYNTGPTSQAPSVSVGPGYCLRNGQKHLQGEQWNEGCDYICTCEDATTGKWKCTQRCRVYSNLPKPYCYLVQDPTDACCQKPECVFTGTTNIHSGSHTPVVTVTQRPTTTPRPTTPKPNVCVYNGKQYSQGQVWYDGCNYKCTCDDAYGGIYRCVNRCPVYQNVPDVCTMVPDQNDPTCCQMPKCNFTPVNNTITGQTGGVATLAPGTYQGTGTGVNIGFCLYKGKQYTQGQRWDDGCEFRCECKDQSTGRYVCTDMCPRYSNLPPQCKLITDFRNPCCKVPDCGFDGTLTSISGQITLAPPMPGQPTPSPNPLNPNPTPSMGVPVLNYCIYKGVKYFQGQAWEDGCDKKCLCDTASEGLYTCNDRCPKYTQALPKECRMVTSTSDPCCQEPQCDIPSLLTNISGTLSPGMIPTLAPPGVISGYANTPTPMPQAPGQTTPAPKPINYCVYKGLQYATGARWDDGCDYTCVCTDGKTGHYDCTEKCPRYGQLPRECYLTKDPANPCCQKPECVFNPNVNEFTNAPTTKAPIPGVTNAPTLKPSGMPTPNPFPTPALPKAVCVYKGVSYTQGQQWYDGCDYTCTCEDAMEGIYRCSKRCTEYPSMTAGCSLVADSNDPLCCKVPKCQVPPKYSNQTGFIDLPTPPPGVITGGSVTKAPTLAPNPGGPTPNPTPAPTPVCVYKGNTYTQGQRWQDGCDFNCECTNAQTGFYKCTEMCPNYNGLPPQCQLVVDVNKPCCKKPYCNFQGITITVTGTPAPNMGTTLVPNPLNPTGPTLVPTPAPPEVCVYNGVQFKQGATWQDGCSLNCVCENGKTGFYRCNERCARYDTVPAGCTMTTDPKDSCCRIPVCAPQPGTTQAPNPGNPNPTLSPNPTPPQVPVVTGSIIGIGVTPTPRPGETPAPNPVPVCVYKGVQYTQGQKWDDGCTYKCECIDAKAGKYKCTKRCGEFLNLPSSCSLINDPNDQCCRVPFCQPTPAPNPNPNPNPNPGTTLAPGTGPTIAPNPNPNPNPTPNPTPMGPTPAPQPKNICTMNGRTYTQGQQWYDGCDRICRCEDGSTGFYRCQDRCSKYDSVPQNCILVADPNDPQCCKVPSCIPGPNGFPTPTPGPDGSTVAPQLITNVPVGVVTGYAKPTPTATPAPVPVGGTTAKPMPTPAPKDVCVYKGVEYIQGQRWQDGCTYNCVCEDGMTGKYKCTDRCPAYPALPPYCTLVQDPKDFCCKQPLCNYQTQAPSIPPPVTPSPAPGQPTPSPAPGQSTPSPNVNPTPAPNPNAVCVYKGVAYKQGATWNEGCVQKCRCDDASKNIYTCFDRCPSYKLNPGCVMTTDPNDPCCQVPSCTVVPTPMPIQTPSPMPGGPTVAPGTVPTPVPSAFPSPIPTGQVGTIVGQPQVPPLRAMCEYKGMQYTTGQKWQDGCQFDCECIDGTSGQYRCTEKCPRFPQIPSYCYMAQDPKEPCCKTPVCNTAVPTPRPNGAPTPGVGSTLPPTLMPPVTPGPIPTPPQPKNACIMNGKTYTQGQQWDDGCKQICVCDDGATGHYTCRSRCAQYPNIAPTCIMVPDPSDPKCCLIPQCDQTNPNQPSGITGSITGTNPTLAPTPNNTPTPVPGMPTTQSPFMPPTPQPNMCVYKGKAYSQGQKWRDGCDFNCECQDGMTGRYVCTEICPRYPNLPAGCVMVNDPANPCCKKPDCSNPTPVPSLTPSPRPGVNPTTAPLNTPVPTFCIYNGIPYQAGKTFEDGCDKICTCENGMSGQVTCKDRCPTFPPLKAGCKMVTDPNDKCCQTPTCVDPQTLVPFSPGGTINGQNVPPSPGSPVTGTRSVCVYNGRTYTQGQQWDDGCTYHCVCLDASTGHYQCTEKCNRVPQLPPYCTMINDPNDQCCQMPYCQNPNPTPNPTQSPNGSPTVAPSPGPNQNPTPAPKPKDVCVFKNSQYYRQDQQWYDGCNAVCRCENAATGYYRCQERCARYTDVPSECTLVPDPKDPSCCQVPKCPVKPTAGPVPTPGYVPTPVTAKPGVLTGLAPVPTPQPTPSPLPGSTPPPTLSPPLPKAGCYYKGVVYQKGQTWSDGCQFDCVCLDDMSGQYQCTEKCTKYPNLDSHCVLLQDTANPCCQKPYCDFVNPTPFPNGIPTPSPIMTPSPMPGNPSVAPNTVPTPNPNPTRAPPPGSCVYKGVFYSQGQTWNDGCDKTCQCDDVTTGYISCHPRCHTYDSVPAGCVLRTDPKDSCCVAPDCNNPNILNPTPQPSPTPGPNGIILTPQVNPSTSGVMIYPSPVPTGSFIGSGIVPGAGSSYPGTIITGSTKACIYKGVAYNQGDKWEDNCQYKCECIDASRGQYKCTDRCYTYPPLPPQCTYERDPNDACCQIAKCTPYVPTYSPITPSPDTPTPRPVITINPNTNPPVTGTPTPGTIVINPNTNPGITGTPTPGNPIVINPNTNPGITGTPTPGNPIVINPGTNTPSIGSQTTPKPSNMCLYKGGLHPQGSNWQDGCDFTCYCVDAKSNSYRCSARCKSYSSLPTYCRLVPDPADQCCEKVECTAPNGQVLVPQVPNGPTTSPTLAPTIQNVIPLGTHQVFTGSGQPNYPISGSPGTSGFRSGCVYKSTVYHQGQSWDDGCKYVCNCMDETTGLYKCTSKCPSYPPLPSYCTFTNVPGQCCPTLSCNSPNFGNYNPAPQLYPTPAPSVQPSMVPQIINPGYNPSVSGSQVVPGTVATGFSGSRNNLCIYKNKLYNQGDKWDDGCEYSCECKDGMSGYYECSPKCPNYNLPAECYLMRAGGDCCPQPMCRNPDGTTVNPLTSPTSQYPVYGTYPGGFTGFRPGYTQPFATGSGSFTNQSNVCIYKGSIYRQGETWDDGCDFKCTCVDQSKGMYQCTARCKTYTNLPSMCKMYDVPGECCSEVRCKVTETSPTPPVIGGPTVRPYLDPMCHDTIDNCKNYQKEVACRGVYEPWARAHCNLTCGFCSPSVTVQPVCADRINNCALYGKSVCTGTYQPWATDNCAKYCNLCSNSGPTTVSPSPPTSAVCQDKLNNCQAFGKSACTGQFEPWARDNCRLYCGFCGSTGTVINSQVLPPTGYTTLMKGVAGVPGDMYQIWTSPATMNVNNPQAMYLTNTFKGHYKVDLSQWNSMCLDRIRVSIYKNGQEKAWIEFNAIGANQNNWFDPSRIISSSYTDIKTATKEVFSMMGDTNSGREFLMSQHSNTQCDTYGWIMISTQNNCPFEASAGGKPAFLYAPGQTSSHFEQTQVGTGDVLAIMGHQGTCIYTVRPTFQVTNTAACVYNNKVYNQGDSWTDGCKYNCTCTDARNGNYQCVELCPTYSSLPQGCSLVKSPGSCCAVPDCGTHVYNPNSNNPAERGLCYYKGDVYSQGEKWDDGCDYTCTCQDATQGRYQCDPKCLSWPSLPAGCTLQPPGPGLCCQQPKCPSNVNIQYPPGYIIQ